MAQARPRQHTARWRSRSRTGCAINDAGVYSSGPGWKCRYALATSTTTMSAGPTGIARGNITALSSSQTRRAQRRFARFARFALPPNGNPPPTEPSIPEGDTRRRGLYALHQGQSDGGWLGVRPSPPDPRSGGDQRYERSRTWCTRTPRRLKILGWPPTPATGRVRRCD